MTVVLEPCVDCGREWPYPAPPPLNQVVEYRCPVCCEARWAAAERHVVRVDATMERAATAMARALALALKYGGTDEGHHLHWVMDQIVRELTLDQEHYAQFVAYAKAGADGPETYGWEEGIAP